MDINQVLNDSKTDSGLIVAKKVQIKCIKQKEKFKTVIKDLDNYLTEKEILSFVKLVSKKLGCSGNKKVDKKKTYLIFSGQQVQNIKNLLIVNNIIKQEYIS
jgi:hypothetical protein